MSVTIDNMQEGMFLTKCIDGLQQLPDQSIDLIIANPPKDNWDTTLEQGNGNTLQEQQVQLFNGIAGGNIYDDFVTFSEKALSEPSIVTYAFTYDKDMCIGSIIKLNLPMWTGDASAVTIVSGCGSSGFDLSLIHI